MERLKDKRLSSSANTSTSSDRGTWPAQVPRSVAGQPTLSPCTGRGRTGSPPWGDGGPLTPAGNNIQKVTRRGAPLWTNLWWDVPNSHTSDASEGWAQGVGTSLEVSTETSFGSVDHIDSRWGSAHFLSTPQLQHVLSKQILSQWNIFLLIMSYSKTHFFVFSCNSDFLLKFQFVESL